MGRTMNEVMASLPKERQERIQACAAELSREIEGLKALRRFVEAAGGTLELRIDLPGTGAFTLTGVGEIDAAKHAA